MATTTKELTDNPIVLRILELIRKRGKKEIDLTEHLGISSGAVSKWKYDGSVVYLKYVDEICEFLDTTPNYLFWGMDEENQILPGERSLLRMYRKFDDGRKKCIRDMMKYMSDKDLDYKEEDVVEDELSKNHFYR
ncbi:MAG: helix-turn-helix domain-containing protein [Lachnospiraceae bacterium]|nr:helix-turn-helix domain-containing protein [Lachnospiraceae bacterium]